MGALEASLIAVGRQLLRPRAPAERREPETAGGPAAAELLARLQSLQGALGVLFAITSFIFYRYFVSYYESQLCWARVT